MPTGQERWPACAAALDELEIEGVATNVELLRLIMSDPHFEAGRLSTRFIEERILDRLAGEGGRGHG